jgi:hypothetical protein
MSRGLKMYVQEESVSSVQAHARDYGKRILRAIKLGMREGMDFLADTVAGLIHSRSGQTAASVRHGVRVTETPTQIIGRIGTGFVGSEPRGVWLERGVNVPAVSGKLMVFQGTSGLVFIRRHAAFRVAARPVFNPSLQALKGHIMTGIQNRMDQVPQ